MFPKPSVVEKANFFFEVKEIARKLDGNRNEKKK